MKLEIIEPNEKVTIKEITKVEKKYKIKFPDDYRNFILEFNGGRPNKLVFLSDYKRINPLHVSNLFSLAELSEFLQLIKEDIESDQEEYMLNYLDFGKKEMIVIGEINDNLELCISTSSNNFGRIYWSDITHDDKFNLLANSFDEFINSFSSQYAHEFEEACENGEYKKARELINNGFDLNLKSYYDDKSVLVIAMEHNLLDVVEKVINALKPEKVIFDAVNYGDINILKLVLDNFHDINEKDLSGRTALFFTTDTQKVKLLIDYGIDINLKDKNGLKAVDYLRPNKNELYVKKTFEMLIEVEERLKNINQDPSN